MKARILISVMLCFLVVSIPSFFVLFSHMNNLVYMESSAADSARVADMTDGVREDLESLITAVAWIADEESVREALSFGDISEPGAAMAVIRAQRAVSTYMAASPASETLNKIVIFNPGTGLAFEITSNRSGAIGDARAIMETAEFPGLSFPTGSVVRLFLSTTINSPEELAVTAYGRIRGSDGFVYAELSSDLFSPLIAAGNVFIVSPGGAYPDAIPGRFYDADDWTEIRYPLPVPDCYVVQFLDRSPLRLASSYGLAVFLVILLASTVLLVLLSFILSRYLTKTTRRLERHIRHLTATNDFGTVDKSIEKGDDEIAAIGRTVNKMSVSISELLKRNEALFEDKKRMEISMLQMQVNPHFLYNTLESIHYLADVQKDDGISRMARGLTTLLRNMAKGCSDRISLADELSLLRDYDDIQQVRYMGMYEIDCRVPESLMGYAIQKFTLQPLVENAIFHGIEPSGRCGTIVIDASLEGDVLSVSVTDDGVGMSEETISHIFDERTHSKTDMTGVGLRNIDERIRLIYGRGYGLSFESEEGRYTKVTVRIRAEAADDV